MLEEKIEKLTEQVKNSSLFLVSHLKDVQLVMKNLTEAINSMQTVTLELPLEEAKPEPVVSKAQTELPLEETKVETKEEVKEPVKEKKKRRSKEEIAADKKLKEEAKVKREEEKKVKYSRTLPEHKDEFIDVLNDVCPGWNKTKGPEAKAAAKGISVSLEGVAMFDKDGKLLGEFVDKVKEGMQEFIGEDI